MKSLVFALTVLAVSQASVVNAPASRANLNVGYISPGDKLLSRQYLYQRPIMNAVQSQDLVFRGNLTNRISAVQAYEMGYTQYAHSWILSGGIGLNYVTIRVQSALGHGFYYQMDIWGR